MQQTDYIPVQDPVVGYLYAIERMETENGAYATELIDMYQGLGKALLDNREFEEARNAFHQGVQIMRVNFGPNSLEQTPYLFSIADIETRTGDWQAAVKVLENVYFINALNYGEDSANMLPVLEQMYEWYQGQRPLYSPLAKLADFQKAMYLAGRMAELSHREYGLGDPATARSYRTLGQIHFLTVRYATSRGISVEPDVVIATGRTGSFQQSTQQVSVRDHFTKGKDAFALFVQSVGENEESTPKEYAEALAQLGDWFLVFEKYQSARVMYQEAYQVLAKSEGAKPLADAYLGEPTPLRFLNNHEDFLADPPEDEAVMKLDISMTVTRGGDVRSIEILNPPEDMTEDRKQKIKKQLESTRFRPGHIDGVAVKMTDFVWRQPIERLE